MYGFLRNVHDQSESEADDTLTSTVQYLQSIGYGSAGREGRITSGDVGRRARRRIENARIISSQIPRTQPRFGARLPNASGGGTTRDDEPEEITPFTRVTTKPFFDADCRVLFDNPELAAEFMRDRPRRSKYEGDSDDEDQTTQEARQAAKLTRRFERLARRRQMARQGQIHGIEKELRSLRVQDLRAALFPNATTTAAVTTTSQNPQRDGDTSQDASTYEDEVERPISVPKTSRRKVATYALLDALMLDCASDNEDIKRAVRVRIRENVNAIRTAMESKENVASDIMAWLSIPGGHALVPESTAQQAVEVLRGDRVRGGTSSCDEGTFTHDDTDEQSAAEEKTQSHIAIDPRETHFLGQLAKTTQQKAAAEKTQALTHEVRERLIRHHAQALQAAASSTLSESARALQAAVEEIAFAFEDEIATSLSPKVRRQIKKDRSLHQERSQRKQRISHHKPPEQNPELPVVNVNVDLDPVDYFKLLEPTYQRTLKRASHSAFLTELEALVIPFKFGQDLDPNHCRPRTFELMQAPNGTSTPMIGTHPAASMISAFVNDPAALAIVCHDSYGQVLAKGIAQFHGLKLDEVTAPNRSQVSILRRQDSPFARHPYSVQAYLKTIVQ